MTHPYSNSDKDWLYRELTPKIPTSFSLIHNGYSKNNPRYLNKSTLKFRSHRISTFPKQPIIGMITPLRQKRVLIKRRGKCGKANDWIQHKILSANQGNTVKINISLSHRFKDLPLRNAANLLNHRSRQGQSTRPRSWSHVLSALSISDQMLLKLISPTPPIDH